MFFCLPKPVTGSMATPSHGGDSDKAIPQSLPPPSVMESCASLQQEDIADQSPCSATDSAYLQQVLEHWLQLEEIVDQSPCSASDLALLPQELLHGNRYDASDISGPTDFTGATSFSGEPSFSGAKGEMEEGHLNSAGCLKKGKRKVRSPRGERGNKKTTGARIEISLDDILQVEQMRLQQAARHLKGTHKYTSMKTQFFFSFFFFFFFLFQLDRIKGLPWEGLVFAVLA